MYIMAILISVKCPLSQILLKPRAVHGYSRGMNDPAPSLILASGSAARRQMLLEAGLEFTVIPASIDEEPLMAAHKDAPEKAAAALARAKALHVAATHPDALVIGSDQVAVFDGAAFSKAASKAEALSRLKSMSGKDHKLISAVCVAHAGLVLWQGRAEAILTMRDIHDDFLREYAAAAGDDLINCAGGYALERAGSWLFSDIKGDHFTILGLPLLPLLCYLGDYHGIKPAGPKS